MAVPHFVRERPVQQAIRFVHDKQAQVVQRDGALLEHVCQPP